jgi:hypothetical protein
MTLHELTHALADRGVKVSIRLVVDAPRGAVTDELRAGLTAHKLHLLARLGREAQWEALGPKGICPSPLTRAQTTTPWRNSKQSKSSHVLI